LLQGIGQFRIVLRGEYLYIYIPHYYKLILFDQFCWLPGFWMVHIVESRDEMYLMVFVCESENELSSYLIIGYIGVHHYKNRKVIEILG
jgi:hypothetical protein